MSIERGLIDPAGEQRGFMCIVGDRDAIELGGPLGSHVTPRVSADHPSLIASTAPNAISDARCAGVIPLRPLMSIRS